jgi:hypothetical protein
MGRACIRGVIVGLFAFEQSRRGQLLLEDGLAIGLEALAVALGHVPPVHLLELLGCHLQLRHRCRPLHLAPRRASRLGRRCGLAKEPPLL